VSFHKNSPGEFREFMRTAAFICGHNIFAHDLVYLQKYFADCNYGLDRSIDTLLLSPLLFPRRPYHRLLKDDKLQTDELNNPLNDAQKARDLFFAEVHAFHALEEPFKSILSGLLCDDPVFSNFFKYVGFQEACESVLLERSIREYFFDRICYNADLLSLIDGKTVELAYALALLYANDRHSITPPWVLKNYPAVETVLFLLTNTPCITDCSYCAITMDPLRALKDYFGFESFRLYDDKPLQYDAVMAVVSHRSIIAVFPTGGGKSITFQVPALMSGKNANALTVIISPLQSLMKDQVDNLENKGITEAVTINGLLDPIERAKSIERVANGSANLLYISPESLRSVSIERLLLKRKIARFVIDEAHCFSSWGQDFRVDYLYIGDFIKGLQATKNLEQPIPVSCFTATAKPKVIEDIKAYFKEKLNLELELFSAKLSRPNLHYQVYRKQTEEDKYNQLRSIIEASGNPTIVYVSRTRRAYELAKRLTEDGFNARPYHGKMDKVEKTANQDEFMTGKVNIMVATSAFGMGVDKSDVGNVIHYDISDSLENYVQEAGRAGRDQAINAECYVLFNEDDLDKHFILLNQTKISSKEINQVWRAIKELTKTRSKVRNSALEIARKAGWDEGINEIETRVKTAIAALEDAGYVKRGQNMPRIFANSILSKSSQEAINKINGSALFDDKQKVTAARIIKKLFSSKSKRLSTEEAAESRVDYLAEQLGIVKHDVIRVIELLREEKILADTKDLTAFLRRGDSGNRSMAVVEGYRKLEDMLLSCIQEEECSYHIKELNGRLIEQGIADCAPGRINRILNFWAIKNYIKRSYPDASRHHIKMGLQLPKKEMEEKIFKRHYLAKLVTEYLFKRADHIQEANNTADVLVEFSVQELKELHQHTQGIFDLQISIDDIEDTLFYLSRIEAIQVEGGFLVVQNDLSLEKLEKNNAKQYTLSDHEKLNQFYLQKVQQIHIVGEYAQRMIRNYQDALQFVDDYFVLNYSSFIRKYFPGSRQDEIKRTLTPEKFGKLFGALSPAQLKIINGQESRIVVAAGPGSGKTRVLVHKLASLLLAEDVKHEQLLMLTFSRAAATEFKKRLLDLIGNAANFIEIKTFHSYCFDLIGRVGSLSASGCILKLAIEKIKSNEIERSRITKTVLVVDEAQDLAEDEYALLQVLMEQNDDLRIVMVGDDDQNIYTFRGADSKYMRQLLTSPGSEKYELVENYRSKKNLVDFANQWVTRIANRMKLLPGYAVSAENGSIEIVEYEHAGLITPLVTSIAGKALAGSTGVLTKKNEAAIQIAGLLIQQGLKAKLIQSNDYFSLSDLFELRCFSDLIDRYAASPQINDDDWAAANKELRRLLENSSKQEMVFLVIQKFEQVNPKIKYKSDWKSFLSESRLDDFIHVDTETIFVSTIHKAKGKEFDNIFLMLEDVRPDNDDVNRELYVAFTRAKTNLHIHYNGNYLRGLNIDQCVYLEDQKVYEKPQQVSIILSHKSVQLGYFAFVQHRVKALASGSKLTICADGLANAGGEMVLKYSQQFKEELLKYVKLGYHASLAKINFKVYWHPQDEDKELLIILPELFLTKA